MMLEIRDLTVRIGTHEIVSISHFDLPRGRSLGLVGESGSGKTLTAMSLAGLQPHDAELTGSIRFDGDEVVGMGQRGLADLRRHKVGLVFQDPLRALNPTMRIGRQVGEAVRLADRGPREAVNGRVRELLRQVQLPDTREMLRRYPHQLSGGQRQRVLIAIAIAARPVLLIADEPTTALDTTVQREILELLTRLRAEEDMALMFVSHDLGVVRAVSDHLAVMYGGRLVEAGPTEEVIEYPRHHYTAALIAANPGRVGLGEGSRRRGTPLHTIPGTVPALGAFPTGCRFRGRCAAEIDRCASVPPVAGDGEHRYACWNPVQHDEEGVGDGSAGHG